MRSVLLTIGGFVLMMVLALASLPWLAWAIGRAALGDDDGYNRANDASPLARWLDWRGL